MAEIKYSNFISDIGKETDKLDHLYTAMDRGARQANVHGVARESNTTKWLNNNKLVLDSDITNLTTTQKACILFLSSQTRK